MKIVLLITTFGNADMVFRYLGRLHAMQKLCCSIYLVVIDIIASDRQRQAHGLLEPRSAA